MRGLSSLCESVGAVSGVRWHDRRRGTEGTPSVSVSKLSLLLKPQFAAGAGSPQI